MERENSKSNQPNWQDFIFDIEFSVGECVRIFVCLFVDVFVVVAAAVP